MKTDTTPNAPEPPPPILTPRKDGIPAELRATPRWILWRLEWIPPKNNKPGRWTKVPYNAITGHRASSTNPATWCDFETAWNAYQASLNTGRSPYCGIGFVLGDGWIGVDLDGCRMRDNGGMSEWAHDALKCIQSYTETSVSGTGIHVICRGTVPPGRRQRDDPDAEHKGIGIYPIGRYFAVSGHVLADSKPITDQTAELAKLHAWAFNQNGHNNGQNDDQTGRNSDSQDKQSSPLLQRALESDAKLRSLWNGDFNGYPSQSEADMALCVKLIYWFGRDAATIDTLFRQSGLMREKWNREDYRKRTLRTALDWQDQTYRENADGTKRKSHARAHAAALDVNALEPTVDALNALEIFQGRIRFESLRRRGSMIQAGFESGTQAIWRTMTDLTTFARSQNILFDATGVLIPTPPARKIRPTWEPIAQLIRRVADRDQANTGPDLKDEFQEVLRATWKRAGCPTAHTPAELVGILQECNLHVRNAENKPPCCAIWIYKQWCWIHQPSLLDWLSTPAAKHKHYVWGEVKEALFLLDFEQKPNFHRSADGSHAKASVWRGPLDYLIDDETDVAEDGEE